MAEIVTPFTSTLSKTQITTRLKQLARAKVGVAVNSFTKFGDIRDVLNTSTPPEQQILEWEPINSFLSKLNGYHNDTSRIALSSIFYAPTQAIFDFTTFDRQYQDVLNTSVTAAGQSVGMVRDAITPLTFGPELVTNGNFAVDANWTKGSGWTISGGAANRAAGGTGSLEQGITLTAGRTYRITFTATLSAGTFQPIFIGGTNVSGTAVSTSGTSVQYMTALSGNITFRISATTLSQGSVDNVSVQEVLGTVAIQSTASLRGVTSSWPVTGRRNLVTRSEPTITQLATRSNVADAGTSITGFSNSIAFGDNSLLRFAYIGTRGITAGSSMTVSAYIQMDDGNAPVLGSASTNGDLSVVLNGNPVHAAGNQTITLVSGSLYRISVVGTTTGADPINNGIVKYTTQSARSFRIAGFQIEVGNTLTAYQQVTSSNLITESGVQSSTALRLDYVDDMLPFTLSTAVNGELFFLGRSGSYRESRSSTSGATVTIGPTGTLSTPGILRAVGDVLAMGFRSGTMTADEWELLKRKYSGLGGKGELLLGSEMITNGTFTTDTTGWTVSNGRISVSGGKLVVENTTAANATAYQVLTTVIGQPYLLSGDITGIVAGGLPRLGAGTGIANNTLLQFQGIAQTTTSFRGVFVASGVSTWINTLTNSTVLGVTAQFDNISVKPLTPEW